MAMDLLRHALLWGLALSAWLTVAFVSLSANPEMWLHDYPPDIRAGHGPMSPAANRQRWLLGVSDTGRSGSHRTDILVLFNAFNSKADCGAAGGSAGIATHRGR